MAIEDVHWADEATLDLLRYLGRRVNTSRGLVLATYRDDEVGPHHPLRHVLGDLVIYFGRTSAHHSALDRRRRGHACRGARHRRVPVVHANARQSVFRHRSARRGRRHPSDGMRRRAGSREQTAARRVVGGGGRSGHRVSHRSRPPRPGCRYRGRRDRGGAGSGMLLDNGDALTFLQDELAREAILSAISPSRRTGLHARVLHALERATGRPRDLRAWPTMRRKLATGGPLPLRTGSGAAGGTVPGAPGGSGPVRAGAALRGDAADRGARPTVEARSYACYLTAQIDQAVSARSAALAIWSEIGDIRREGGTTVAISPGSCFGRKPALPTPSARPRRRWR